MTEQFPWLTMIVLLPLVAALFIPLIPDKSGKTVRWYALGLPVRSFLSEVRQLG